MMMLPSKVQSEGTIALAFIKILPLLRKRGNTKFLNSISHQRERQKNCFWHSDSHVMWLLIRVGWLPSLLHLIVTSGFCCGGAPLTT